MAIDLPSQLPAHVLCSIAAAVKYQIPANALLAVAQKEGGRPGLWVLNKNGSYDVGSMQFNTAYLKDLRGYGITPQDVAASGCYPFELAAWRIRQHIRNDQGDLWTRVANYHSRSYQDNLAYRADLIRKSAVWAGWLTARFPTFEVNWASGYLGIGAPG